MDLKTLLEKDPNTLTAEERDYIEKNHCITRWSPDTCGCVVSYSWDRTTPEDSREHLFHSFDKKCDDHAGLKMDTMHYGHVLDENQSKNMFHGHLLDAHPRLTKTTLNENGDAQKDFSPGIQYRWSFTGKDGNRRLQVSVPGASLTIPEKAALNAFSKGLKKPIDLT